MFAGEFIKSQQKLDQLILSRERLYGRDSLNLLKPIQTIAQLMRLQQNHEAAQVFMAYALKIVANLLGEEQEEEEEKKDAGEE